jgi:hypothetical protein
LAGAAVRNDIQIFSRNITYKPSWTINNFSRAIYSIDWGNRGGYMALGGGDSKCYILESTKYE